MKKCPECGTPNKPIATECARCGAPLESGKVDFDADQSKLDAANMFNAPMDAMPVAPGSPGMPKVPGAPKMPGAPKPPSM